MQIANLLSVTSIWPERRQHFLERHLLNISQPAVECLMELIAVCEADAPTTCD